jgi:hypothetical protein
MKYIIILILPFLISCYSSRKIKCQDFSWNPAKFEIMPKDSVTITVSQVLMTFYGNYVKSTDGKWYRYCWGYELEITQPALVYKEWEDLPPCR